MPIEIKEMHIKINVNEGSSAPSSGSKDAESNVIQECLDQVVKMLNTKEER